MSHGSSFQTASRWRCLCWGLVCFLGLQLGLGLSLDRWLLPVRDPEYAAREQQLRALRAEMPGQPLVLMLGSSRTLLGFQASRQPATTDPPALLFNFGLVGGGPVLEWLCLRRLLAAGIRPDLLFVEVLPPALNQAGDHSLEEDWLSGTRLSASELLQVGPYHSHPSRLWQQWCRARSLPALRQQAELHQWLDLDHFRPGAASPLYTAVDDHGWHAHPLPGLSADQRRRLADYARHQYQDSFGDFHLAAPPSRALHDLLSCCRQEHLTVVLVLMPEASDFQALYPSSLRHHLDAYLDEVSRTWDVPLIDARTWVADDGFWDGHHLLPEGATVFTERFECQAIRPLLQERMSRQP